MNYSDGGYSLSDIAAATGNNRNNDGFGNDGWWIILLLLALGGGWGNGFGGFGGGFGGGVGNEYAWLSNGQKEIMQNTNQGFDTLQLANQLTGINSGVQDLSTQICNSTASINSNLCNGFAGVNATINGGFANAETAANARQMANMNQAFNSEITTLNGFNNLNNALSNCCCENRLGIANLTSTVLSENCADRAALSDGVRDIITNQTANTQRILDQMCNDKIDAKNEKIADLERQLSMANLQASQVAQTAELRANNATVANQLVSELRSCPIPSQPVYGNQPIFTYTSGCGCNGGINSNF